MSSFRKVWTSISKYGLRAGTKDALAKWLRSQPSIQPNVLEQYYWILNVNRAESLTSPAKGPLRINWILPTVRDKGSGGLSNIFRAIHLLESWGHRQYVYIFGSIPKNGKALDFVREHYAPITTEIRQFQGEVEDSDALVATGWSTAYIARSLGNTARKFYFVQDLEYLFYPRGSLHEFAKQTYTWGYYGITLGQWIADVLGREFGMECAPFGFCHDHAIYRSGPRSAGRRQKERVVFYARPSTERRGFEEGMLALALVARKRPETEFVLVGFEPGSIDLPFSAVLPGILPPSELATLFRECTVALVLSHTNVSLLPLELMACGCAVVSNSGPNVEWLLSHETAQLVDANPEALAVGILALLENEYLRLSKVEAGLKLAQQADWTSEVKTIEAAFYRGLKTATANRLASNV